jgi:hypothetical protein
MSLVVREAPRCVLPQGGRHREGDAEGGTLFDCCVGSLRPSSIAVWARYGHGGGAVGTLLSLLEPLRERADGL